VPRETEQTAGGAERGRTVPMMRRSSVRRGEVDVFILPLGQRQMEMHADIDI
jgi:hypothetical protein